MDTGDGFWTISALNGRQEFDAQRITMPELARILIRYLEDQVIDMTGLNGAYQVSLEVPRQMIRAAAGRPTRDGAAAAPPSAAPDPDGDVNIFAAVQKLGLMLEHRKAPVEQLVVDHAGKVPTEN
jgi:uncharacterized protein (TIGR03435 family)